MDQAFSFIDHQICFAVKSNSNLAVLNVLAKLGSGFDIVTGGELARVLAAGGDATKIVFSGLGKQEADIQKALEVGIACFNVESHAELDRIQKVAADSVFETYQYAASLPNLDVIGIDCHIGSQLTETQPFVDALDRVIMMIAKLKELGIQLKHIDIGGGLGVTYKDETPPSVAEYANAMRPALEKLGLKVYMEPGRSISANAGVLVTKVDLLKPTNYRNFAIIDAAMNDLIRPSLYQAWMDIQPVISRIDFEAKTWDIVGAICETGDFLGKERELAIQENDNLAVLGAAVVVLLKSWSMLTNQFTKMHGLGNDFMVVDLISQRAFFDAMTIRRLADRHFGIGFDQLLIVEPPDFPNVDFKYRIFNADGSEVEQCGNGVRCFARFVYERQLTNKKRFKVQTCAGIVEPELGENGWVRVNMGYPKFLPNEIPFLAEEPDALYDIALQDNELLTIDVVNMGNPHAVTIVPDVLTADVAKIGPQVEAHARFPQRVNAGFMQIVDEKHARLRVFERGVGETMACGTGACAAAVSGMRRGLLANNVEIELAGGKLQIEWKEGDVVWMTGPTATIVLIGMANPQSKQAFHMKMVEHILEFIWPGLSITNWKVSFTKKKVPMN
ncbi:unnamed protein product [Oppiella nova]|uniref:diaminopimelate epimerase n=1 Tax=Oppiella nova TaxID=334625 RepID=A0A7R9Q8V3_9ACAR|nr:unnamed protein product [Oppiella nova]CAG2158209.1 unnamed protein product [Oppiella nova]